MRCTCTYYVSCRQTKLTRSENMEETQKDMAAHKKRVYADRSRRLDIVIQQLKRRKKHQQDTNNQEDNGGHLDLCEDPYVVEGYVPETHQVSKHSSSTSYYNSLGSYHYATRVRIQQDPFSIICPGRRHWNQAQSTSTLPDQIKVTSRTRNQPGGGRISEKEVNLNSPNTTATPNFHRFREGRAHRSRQETIRDRTYPDSSQSKSYSTDPWWCRTSTSTFDSVARRTPTKSFEFNLSSKDCRRLAIPLSCL